VRLTTVHNNIDHLYSVVCCQRSSKLKQTQIFVN